MSLLKTSKKEEDWCQRICGDVIGNYLEYGDPHRNASLSRRLL